MALNGVYPTLLVGMIDALTSLESLELNELQALANPDEIQLARISILKLKSLIPVATLARMPIILDGKIIKAQPSNYQTTMVKQMEIYGDNSIGIKSAANTVTISIETVSSATGVSVFPDIMYSVADIIFSKKDNVPRISYFGDNIIIPDGYLTRMSKSSNANSEKEVITLEIQKDIESSIVGKATQAVDKPPFSVNSSWISR